MKKIVTLLVIVTLAACGSSTTDKKSGTDITKDPVYQKGLALVAKNQCFTCHNIDGPLTGPSYREVANKYGGWPDTIVEHLAQKVITGGNGVWGEIFMTPHPGISDDDAKAMVQYILLLKK